MLKKSENPQITELTLAHRGRRLNLSEIAVPISDGKKGCCWCCKPLVGRQLKWCSGECSSYAWAWANPQKEGGLHVLLARQDFKCLTCQFDYMPYVTDTLKYLNHKRQTVDPASIGDKICERLMKILKYKVPSDRLPEVDHIVPVAKGGQALGFENHQCICYQCHKAKTRIDNSGPRKKKLTKLG